MPPSNGNQSPASNSPEPAKPHLEQYTSSNPAPSPLGGPLELPEDQTQDTSNVPPSPHEFKRKSKKPLIIVIVLLLLVAAGSGAWMFLKKDSASQDATTTQNTEQTIDETPPVPTTEGTKTYTNDSMRLSINYPDNWTVTEESKAALIQSPDFTYNTVDEGKVTGNFRLYIRQGAQATDSAVFAKGYAIAPSEKLAYTQPTTNQRKETLISSFGLDTTDNFAYFLIAGNFDLKKGDTLGPNYGKEPETYIIAGGYSSKDIKESLKTYRVPLDEYQESTAYKQAVEALKSIQIK